MNVSAGIQVMNNKYCIMNIKSMSYLQWLVVDADTNIFSYNKIDKKSTAKSTCPISVLHG